MSNMKKKMLSVLMGAFPMCEVADEFDIEAAIYWYCSDNYDGQADPLYAVMCESKFRPSCLHQGVEDESETAAEMYAVLKNHGF